MTMDDDRRAMAIALADIYVATNQLHDILESRLTSIQQALTFGATMAQIAEVMDARPALWP
jgi:hypothetical protein